MCTPKDVGSPRVRLSIETMSKVDLLEWFHTELIEAAAGNDRLA